MSSILRVTWALRRVVLMSPVPIQYYGRGLKVSATHNNTATTAAAPAATTTASPTASVTVSTATSVLLALLSFVTAAATSAGPVLVSVEVKL